MRKASVAILAVVGIGVLLLSLPRLVFVDKTLGVGPAVT